MGNLFINYYISTTIYQLLYINYHISTAIYINYLSYRISNRKSAKMPSQYKFSQATGVENFTAKTSSFFSELLKGMGVWRSKLLKAYQREIKVLLETKDWPLEIVPT